MDCDAKKKTLLKDLDGSFLGTVGSVIPQSEFEWDGDPRRGLGDYRIPKVMLTFSNGSRIPVDQIAPHKGRYPSNNYIRPVSKHVLERSCILSKQKKNNFIWTADLGFFLSYAISFDSTEIFL